MLALSSCTCECESKRFLTKSSFIRLYIMLLNWKLSLLFLLFYWEAYDIFYMVSIWRNWKPREEMARKWLVKFDIYIHFATLSRFCEPFIMCNVLNVSLVSDLYIISLCVTRYLYKEWKIMFRKWLQSQ